MLRLQWQPGSDVTLRDATATELTNVAGMLDAPQTTSSSDSPAVRHLHGLVTATAAANPYYEHHMPEFRKEVMAGWHMFGHFCVVWKVTPLETSNYGCLKLAGMDIDMLHTSRGKPAPDYTERVVRIVANPVACYKFTRAVFRTFRSRAASAWDWTTTGCGGRAPASLGPSWPRLTRQRSPAA